MGVCEVKLKLVFKALLGCTFVTKRADLPAAFHRSSTIIESLVKCKQIFFLMIRWLEILDLKANVELKTFPKVGNFELKSHPKG